MQNFAEKTIKETMQKALEDVEDATPSEKMYAS